MLAIASLFVALGLSRVVNERFLEFNGYTPFRAALLLAALISAPLYFTSPWLSLASLPYALLLYVTLPIDKKYAPSRQSRRLAARLPGPPVYVPYFGHAFLFASMTPENMIAFFKEKCAQFPRLFTFKVFGSCWTILREPEDLEILLGSMKYIEKGPEYTTLTPWLREGLLISSGEKWKTRRKLFTPTFHFKILENNLDSLNKNSRILLKKLLDKKHQPLDVDRFIRLCTLDIITETAMGISLNAQDDRNSDYIGAIRKVSEISVIRILKFWLYKKFVFMCTLAWPVYRKALQIVHGFSGKIIRERKEFYRTRQFIDKKPKPFLDCLIELDQQNPNTLSDFDIREEVDTFMFEGHDTTSSALTFCLLLLGNYSDVQDRAFEEQNEIFKGSDRPTTFTDLKAMTYLEQVIKEVIRLYPPVPMMTRFLVEDLQLPGNLVLPAKSSVIFSPFLTHRDSKHFPEPDLFDPERFSQENSQKRHPFAYIPFSAGPRNCIGQKFAMMELKSILSTLLRFARIEGVTRVNEVKPLPHLILKPDRPVVIRVHPRPN